MLQFLKNMALAGVVQWVERQPVNQKIAGPVPSQDTCLDCQPGPQQGAHKRQPHIDVSLLLFLSPVPSLNINKILKVDPPSKDFAVSEKKTKALPVPT